jgi:hypothetical protein
MFPVVLRRADIPAGRGLGPVKARAYCYHHVQTIMLAIDQYAETALGNRNYFLNRPHGIESRILQNSHLR